MAEPSEIEIELFNAALELPVEQRATYLDASCAGDSALQRRVEALLQTTLSVGNFLEDPLVVPPEAPVSAAAPADPKIDEWVGRYKLIQQIGEGGCGVVFLAMQEEPVRRQVALKLIKLGMDTKSVIARFEAERQALALMDHPHIARVLDAGVAENGRSYFVMELVRGTKITDYCDENQLSTAERLELFVQVCRAVQHAHQKGIIHRDLKPSNVLVANHDGVPMPKVIDFGIAKATQGKLADCTVFTAFEQFMGTPAYMSPEQAEPGAVDIDTRSDIYSLGVLLYELLTGQTPYDGQTLGQAGLDEIRRTIREIDPARPSTRLGKMPGAVLTAAARRRGIEPPKLIHSVRGDLDWIVMKALEKKRDRRYETANGLAADIQRYLKHEPVAARPPGLVYTLQKLVRRHKLAFTAGLLGLAALILCLGMAVVALVYINRARQETTKELRATYLAEARATRLSGQPGKRFASLDAVQKAAAIQGGMDVRNEAIASLALVDLAVAREVVVKGHSRNELAAVDLPLKRYAFPETNGSITLHSAEDGHLLSVLPAPGYKFQGIGGFSADGRYLSARYWHEPEGESDWVWDTQAEKAVIRVYQPVDATNDWNFYFAEDFSPDGRTFFSSRADGTIALYELPSGREIKVFPCGHPFHHLAADLQSRWLACGARWNSLVEIRELATGKVVRTVSCPPGVSALAWSADGRRLATGGIDLKIYVWDAFTGGQLAVLPGHAGLIMSVAFNPAGDLLASSSYDSSIRLWDWENGRELARHPGSSWGLQFSPSGSELLGWQNISHFGWLTVAGGRECRMLSMLGIKNFLSVPAFSADGRLLAVVSGDQVRFWDAASGRVLGTLPLPNADAVVFPPDGRSLITVDHTAGVCQRRVERTLSADSLRWRLGRPRTLLAAAGLQEAALSQDGHYLATTRQTTGDSFVLDLRDPAANVVLRGHSQVNRIALSPDGRWAATGSFYNPLVKIWDARSGKLIRSFSEPARTGVAFSPDGRWLATSSSEYQLWDVGTWQPRDMPQPTREDAIGSYTAFSPDGQIMARTDASKIQLLATATGRLLGVLEAPGGGLALNCRFSADGTRLAAARNDRQLLLWDLRTLRAELAQTHLDWDQPAYPPESQTNLPPPLALEIEENGSP